MSGETSEKDLLPHHEQLPLCTTRLPYRQGRKLTAVKTYTITNESNHLLIFGVPSLNLRQEAKSLLLHFGKLLQFYSSDNHPAEPFTETYHARYDKIQSARIAKRMLDTKNFYGGSLHVCYAPELETIEETRLKLNQRKRDVTFRLRNLQKEENKKEEELKHVIVPEKTISQVNEPSETIKMNMGETNFIYMDKKRKNTKNCKYGPEKHSSIKKKKIDKERKHLNVQEEHTETSIEVVDCTNTNEEVISNINGALNYNNFGNEVVRKVKQKPLNSIVFYSNKKT